MNLRLGGSFREWLLKRLSKNPMQSRPDEDGSDAGLQGAAKLQRFLGRQVWREFENRRVLDFGCGHGAEAVAAAEHGAEFVLGIEIQPARLEAARRRARDAGVADRCRFLHPVEDAREIAELEGTIDVAYSIDSFEHYARPEVILDRLHELLAPGGRLLISFGPPWKHPYGGHLRYFCRWPWIHLLFREETIMAVRALHRNDGARRFADVEGGLNQMTLSRFRKLVQQSSFELEEFRPIPFSSRFVNGPRFWHPLGANPLLREYLTSVVLCRLRKPLMEHAEHAQRSVEAMDLHARLC